MTPDPINDPTVWQGSDFAKPRAWVIELENTMRDEIVAVTKDVHGVEVAALSNAYFPLPGCESIIKQVRD